MKPSQALLAGARRAFGNLKAVSALFAVNAGEALLALTALRALPLLLDPSAGVAPFAGVGAAAVAWLLLQLVRAVFIYRALGAGAAEWGASVARALGYFALSSALGATVQLWWWSGLFASGRAYWLLAGEGPALAPSFALATVLAAGPLVALFVAGWAQLSLVRSATTGEPYSASLAWGAGALVQSPWLYVMIIWVTGYLKWGVEVGLAGLGQAPGPAAMAEAPLLSLGAALSGGFGAALASAVVELTRLYALQAAQGAKASPRPILTAPLVDAPRGD